MWNSGYLPFDRDRLVSKEKLKQMTDIIKHRGPDGDGYFIENNVGLGHRRLSIIDLNTGDQPMYSDDGNKVIIFNGEIYNYIELREELSMKGYVFKTNSDTEVVIKNPMKNGALTARINLMGCGHLLYGTN